MVCLHNTLEEVNFVYVDINPENGKGIKGLLIKGRSMDETCGEDVTFLTNFG
jgi:hypothetical protein